MFNPIRSSTHPDVSKHHQQQNMHIVAEVLGMTSYGWPEKIEAHSWYFDKTERKLWAACSNATNAQMIASQIPQDFSRFSAGVVQKNGGFFIVLAYPDYATLYKELAIEWTLNSGICADPTKIFKTFAALDNIGIRDSGRQTSIINDMNQRGILQPDLPAATANEAPFVDFFELRRNNALIRKYIGVYQNVHVPIPYQTMDRQKIIAATLRNAARNGNCNDVTSLLPEITNINATGPINGMTALHSAAIYAHDTGDESCLDLLAGQPGADLSIKDKAGKTVAMYRHEDEQSQATRTHRN